MSRPIVSLGIHAETGLPMITLYPQRVCGCQDYEHDRDCLYHPRQALKERNSYEREAINAERNSIGATIARAPLVAELRDLRTIAATYQDQADQHTGQATRLAMLARQANEQADNLEKLAGL